MKLRITSFLCIVAMLATMLHVPAFAVDYGFAESICGLTECADTNDSDPVGTEHNSKDDGLPTNEKPLDNTVKDQDTLYIPESEEGYSISDIPDIVYTDNSKMGTLPPITLGYFYNADERIATHAYGEGDVVTRVREWQTASNGLRQTDIASGTYLNIASILLSFSGYAPAMAVSTIFSLLGLGISDTEYVKAQTFVSYRYTYRDGEARWSTDPNQNSYYHPAVRTGQSETFKHIFGSILNEKTQKWTTYRKDYPTPVSVDRSDHYNKTS